MNLDTMIRHDLWLEISSAYESSDYKNAIINAMHYLTKILREKADSDLDGYKLVNEALGGKNPKLKINKFQTQSEIDEQEGFTQIIIGLYKGIRNPRSHEIVKDTKDDAGSIIFFIDYVITVIDKSNPTFTLEGFLSQVFDNDFVEKEEYAIELLNEIPKKRLGEVLIEIYRKRHDGDFGKLRIMVMVILENISEMDLNLFLNVISDDFQKVSKDFEIITALNLIPKQLWGKLRKAPRMRIENKIINSIKKGEIKITDTNQVIRDDIGVLGTWASEGLTDQFSLKEEVKEVLYGKLVDIDLEDNLYVIKYFMHDIQALFTKDEEIRSLGLTVKRLIEAGEKNTPDLIMDFITSCPQNHRFIITEALKDFLDPDNPSYYLPDGNPFLGKEEKIPTINPDNSIPF